MKRAKSLIINTFLLFFVLALFQCVPVRKQLVLKDKKFKTLKGFRTVDTTLTYPYYSYKLKKNDILSLNFSSITKGEYDISQLGQQGNYGAAGGRMMGGGMQNGPGNTGFIVNDTGYVVIPVLGALKLEGYTLKEAEKLIQTKTNELLVNTHVNVRLISFFIYMMGEIGSQGQVFAPGDRLTLIEAIALSGGFTDYSDRQHIKIIRNQNHTAHIYYVDLSDQNFITQSQIYLLPQDIVVIEPLRAKVVKNYAIPNITLMLSTVTFMLSLTLTILNLTR